MESGSLCIRRRRLVLVATIGRENRRSIPLRAFANWRLFLCVPASAGFLRTASLLYHPIRYHPIRSEERSANFNAWINDEAYCNHSVSTSTRWAITLRTSVSSATYLRGKTACFESGFLAQAPRLRSARSRFGRYARKQLPIRLITQPTPFTDHRGQFWQPDTCFLNGGLLRNPTPQWARRSRPLPRERYRHFTYAIPVDTRDRYALVLHFAELYFGPAASGNGGVGSRMFNDSNRSPITRSSRRSRFWMRGHK